MTSLVEEISFAIFIIYAMTALRDPKYRPKLIVPDLGQAKDENKLDANIYIHHFTPLFPPSLLKVLLSWG